MEFKTNLEPFTVFSLTDIEKIYPGFDNRRLVEWQQRGYLRKITRGYYMFNDEKITESTHILVANKIYGPSYVSLEFALFHYNLIPEAAYTVTSVTTQKTQRFDSPIGSFSYQSFKKEFYFGYQLQIYTDRETRFAEPEKAVLDFLYLHSEYRNQDALYEWRLNTHTFQSLINRDKLLRYSGIFNHRALNRRVKLLLDFIDHA